MARALTPVAQLRRALDRRKAAEDEIERVLREQFPAGAFVAFVGHNGNTLLGRIVSHGYRERIKIENCKTGRAYWVQAWRLK